jgi:hypothetical protein
MRFLKVTFQKAKDGTDQSAELQTVIHLSFVSEPAE